jgi:hypothetical protein
MNEPDFVPEGDRLAVGGMRDEDEPIGPMNERLETLRAESAARLPSPKFAPHWDDVRFLLAALDEATAKVREQAMEILSLTGELIEAPSVAEVERLRGERDAHADYYEMALSERNGLLDEVERLRGALDRAVRIVSNLAFESGVDREESGFGDEVRAFLEEYDQGATE